MLLAGLRLLMAIKTSLVFFGDEKLVELSVFVFLVPIVY